jgi:hypothetical protein
VLPAQADQHHVAFFGGAGLQLVAHRLQVQRRQWMVEGHDLDQAAALGTFKK